MRGALYEICAIYRRCSESARRRANDGLVKRPLIRLRHLLPQQKTAGGEGLSIGGTAENEPLAQLHIVLRRTTLNPCLREAVQLPPGACSLPPDVRELVAGPRTGCAAAKNLPSASTPGRQTPALERWRSVPLPGVQPHLRATSTNAILKNVGGRLAAWQNSSTD